MQGVQIGDLTQTDRSEEIESQFLETPLVEKIVDADRLMGHSLPGSATLMRMHSLAIRMTIARVWIHLYGIQAQMIVAG